MTDSPLRRFFASKLDSRGQIPDDPIAGDQYTTGAPGAGGQAAPAPETYATAGTAMTSEQYLRQRILETPGFAPSSNVLPANSQDDDGTPRPFGLADLHRVADAERQQFIADHTARQYDDGQAAPPSTSNELVRVALGNPEGFEAKWGMDPTDWLEWAVDVDRAGWAQAAADAGMPGAAQPTLADLPPALRTQLEGGIR